MNVLNKCVISKYVFKRINVEVFDWSSSFVHQRVKRPQTAAGSLRLHLRARPDSSCQTHTEVMITSPVTSPGQGQHDKQSLCEAAHVMHKTTDIQLLCRKDFQGGVMGVMGGVEAGGAPTPCRGKRHRGEELDSSCRETNTQADQ